MWWHTKTVSTFVNEFTKSSERKSIFPLCEHYSSSRQFFLVWTYIFGAEAIAKPASIWFDAFTLSSSNSHSTFCYQFFFVGQTYTIYYIWVIVWLRWKIRWPDSRSSYGFVRAHNQNFKQKVSNSISIWSLYSTSNSLSLVHT